MVWRHPYLALMHIVDGRRPAPPRPNETGAAESGVPDRAPKHAAPPAAESKP
jgi:hypothetical protein